MLHYWVVESMIRERMEAFDAELKTEALLHDGLAPRTPLRRRLMMAIAGRLISTGTYLEKRYTPTGHSQTEPDCSPC